MGKEEGLGGSGKVSKGNALDSPPSWLVRKKPEKTRAEAPMTNNWLYHTCPCTDLPGPLGRRAMGSWMRTQAIVRIAGLVTPLCHCLVSEERSHCRRKWKDMGICSGGQYLNTVFLCMQIPQEKHGVQPVSWRTPCYVRVQPKTNKTKTKRPRSHSEPSAGPDSAKQLVFCWLVGLLFAF